MGINFTHDNYRDFIQKLKQFDNENLIISSERFEYDGDDDGLQHETVFAEIRKYDLKNNSFSFCTKMLGIRVGQMMAALKERILSELVHCAYFLKPYGDLLLKKILFYNTTLEIKLCIKANQVYFSSKVFRIASIFSRSALMGS